MNKTLTDHETGTLSKNISNSSSLPCIHILHNIYDYQIFNLAMILELLNKRSHIDIILNYVRLGKTYTQLTKYRHY